MRCITYNDDANAAEALSVSDVPVPEVGEGHVLIRVTHAGVNRPDILQRRGLYPQPPGASPVLGLEVAGHIESLPKGAGFGWKSGDAVCALVNGGGYAQFVAVDTRHLMPVPAGVSLAEAASLPEVAITVYANLCEHGAFRAGETVLIHGANSGIGSMTIQMGKALGAKVIATARGADKCAFAASLGADLVIDTALEDFVAPVKAAGGADVILDIVGGDYADKNIIVLKPKGRLVQIGFGKTSKVEIDLSRLMVKQAILTGSTLRPRSPDEKARLIGKVREVVWPLIEAGKIKPVLDKVFDFAGVAAAHDYLETGKQCGKVVLKL
jgi:NADPH:quinone reductase